MEYVNSISIDQVFANLVGEQTRLASLVMSTDGGTGTARGAHTLSFDRQGRPIPAEHRPKQIFDKLFVTSDADSAKRLASVVVHWMDMLSDAKSLRSLLSTEDRKQLDEYMESVRQAETKVEKAKHWLNARCPRSTLII